MRLTLSALRFISETLLIWGLYYSLPLMWGWGSFPIATFIIGLLTALTFWHSRYEKKKDRERLPALVHEHKYTLKRELSASVKKNAYGVVVEDGRGEALSEFMKSFGLLSSNRTRNERLGYKILEILDEDSDDIEGFDPESIPKNGHDFEDWIADTLGRFGWDASVTQGSGDQGLDVLAKKDSVSVGIQSKLYFKPVGNKAVQEILAAQKYYGFDKACVLTNMSYTKSAQSLAKASGVSLLTHYDIPNFDKIFLAGTSGIDY